MAESVMGIFKTELHRNPAALAANGGPWRGLDDLEIATCAWVSWFNEERLHSELDDRTPAGVRSRLPSQVSARCGMREPNQRVSGKPRPVHIEADTTVLVQYKRMKRDSKGRWFYRPDSPVRQGTEADEEGRQSVVSRPLSKDVAAPSPAGAYSNWFDNRMSSIPVAIAYFLASTCHWNTSTNCSPTTLTQRGARGSGYDTIDRYITNGLFVDLVRQGSIGTRGLTTEAVTTLINAAVGSGRSVLLAEELGGTSREQSGANARLEPDP